jgi:hypothetical protein
MSVDGWTRRLSMRKQWLVAALVLGFVGTLLVPISAFATAKATTAFRPMQHFYTIPNGSTETSVTGRLMYSKVVKVGHRYVRVGGGLKGTVYLYWFNRATRGYQNVASAVSTATGYFSLPASEDGDYYVLYKESSAAQSAKYYLEVFSDAFSVNNVRATATLDPDGSAFVVASADMSAPVGLLTTSTPADGYFSAHETEATQNVYVGGGFDSTYYFQIPSTGTYKWGFTVPSSALGQKLALTATLESWGFYWPASATTSFTVSSLLGP